MTNSITNALVCQTARVSWRGVKWHMCQSSACGCLGKLGSGPGDKSARVCDTCGIFDLTLVCKTVKFSSGYVSISYD